MNRVTLLAELQTLDTRIEENRQALKQLAARLADDSTVASVQKTSDAIAQQEHQLRTRLRDFELEVKGLDEQIRTVSARIYGGKVTNAKELSGLTRDEEMLKRHKSDIEDKMLDVMGQLETVQAQAATARATLDKVTATRNLEKAQDSAKLKVLETTGTQLEHSRADLRARLSPEDLQVYDSLYQSKKGRAVAHIKGTSCAACGYALPSGIASRAKMGEDLVFCSNCSRILVP